MASARAPRRSVTRLSFDDRMDDIMTAARAVITEKGYEKVLISDIAERAGVVEGTIYRYFANKRELLNKVAEVWFGEQLGHDPQLAQVQGTRNRLRHLASLTLSIIRREPVLARYMLMELRPDPQYRGSVFFDLNREFTSGVLDVCREAIASGEFRRDVSATMLRDMLFGCIEHRTWAFLRGEGDFSADDVADGIATVIWRGMAAGPEAESESDVGIASAITATPADRLDHVTARLEAAVEALEARLPKA